MRKGSDMARQFPTEKEFAAAISSYVAAPHIDPTIASAITIGVVAAEHEVRAGPALPGNTALNVRLGGFVIRDADVPFLEVITAVATAVAAASSTAGLTASLVIAAVTSLAQLCWNVWRKGVVLNDAQILVLGLLNARGPLSLRALADLVRQQRPGADLAFAKKTLLSLSELELSDGQIITLATRDVAGFWHGHRI
jgi:hypothetical protein